MLFLAIVRKNFVKATLKVFIAYNFFSSRWDWALLAYAIHGWYAIIFIFFWSVAIWRNNWCQSSCDIRSRGFNNFLCALLILPKDVRTFINSCFTSWFIFMEMRKIMTLFWMFCRCHWLSIIKQRERRSISGRYFFSRPLNHLVWCCLSQGPIV